MNQNLENLAVALDNLATNICTIWAEERRFSDAISAHFSPITKRDVARSATDLAEKIRNLDEGEIDKDLDALIVQFTQSAAHLQAHIVPHFFNGNNINFLPRYYEYITALTVALSPLISNHTLNWEKIEDQELLPHKIRRRLKSYNANIDTIDGQIGNLEEKVKAINAAHNAAELLPADIQDLKNARESVNKALAAAEVSRTTIERNEKASEAALNKIESMNEQAKDLVNRCEEAYRITTTKGLAAAFEVRAKDLAFSMWIWVAGLILALFCGAYFGSHRVAVLTETMANNPNNTPLAILQIIVVVFSVGAPLWFAWIATKQIGQRFRLAEDYAFKSSVSKAYEGYRKEAVRLDVKFESRLFDSAMQRLEEAPLRLIESDSHGSPWHELISSETFQKALDKVPNFGDKIGDLLKKKSGTETPKQSNPPENKDP